MTCQLLQATFLMSLTSNELDQESGSVLTTASIGLVGDKDEFNFDVLSGHTYRLEVSGAADGISAPLENIALEGQWSDAVVFSSFQSVIDGVSAYKSMPLPMKTFF